MYRCKRGLTDNERVNVQKYIHLDIVSLIWPLLGTCHALIIAYCIFRMLWTISKVTCRWSPFSRDHFIVSIELLINHIFWNAHLPKCNVRKTLMHFSAKGLWKIDKNAFILTLRDVICQILNPISAYQANECDHFLSVISKVELCWRKRFNQKFNIIITIYHKWPNHTKFTRK